VRTDSTSLMVVGAEFAVPRETVPTTKLVLSVGTPLRHCEKAIGKLPTKQPRLTTIRPHERQYRRCAV